MRILLLHSVLIVGSLMLVDLAAGQTQPNRNGAIPARTQINQGPPQAQANNPQRPPQGWEVTPEQQQWIDQILKYWETSSGNVERFSCQFERWEYNPAFIRDPKIHWTQAVGEIKYEKPDKAVYRVTELRHYQPPQAQGQRVSYVRRDEAPGEYWLCDGQATFEFDFRNKQVKSTPLPQHMRGAAVAEGPLPFLFGAKAEKLKQRFWFKPLTPPKVKNPQTGKEEFIQGEYWLAAKPKTRQDAMNYDMVELIIDQKRFLPKAMQIYMPGGKERKVFQFSQRTINERQRFWEGNFIKPDVPRGWKLVREDPAARAQTARANIAQQRGGGSQIPIPQR